MLLYNSSDRNRTPHGGLRTVCIAHKILITPRGPFSTRTVYIVGKFPIFILTSVTTDSPSRFIRALVYHSVYIWTIFKYDVHPW